MDKYMLASFSELILILFSFPAIQDLLTYKTS